MTTATELRPRGLYRDHNGTGPPVRVKEIRGDRVIVCAALQEGYDEADWNQPLAATAARLAPCTEEEAGEIEAGLPEGFEPGPGIEEQLVEFEG